MIAPTPYSSFLSSERGNHKAEGVNRMSSMISRKYRISLVLFFPTLIVLLILLYFIDNALAGNKKCIPLAEYAGKSEGKADIYVIWCEQDSLPYSFTVNSDGTVEGTVGDAKLVNGIFKKNRSFIGRMLHIRTDYVIYADLEGPLVKQEDIVRKSTYIFKSFNKEKNIFDISIQTSGTWGGGKKSMCFTATTK
jgi:hypothetical protein